MKNVRRFFTKSSGGPSSASVGVWDWLIRLKKIKSCRLVQLNVFRSVVQSKPQIPNMKSTIRTAWSKHCFILRWPLSLFTWNKERNLLYFRPAYLSNVYITWKISSLCDSNVANLILRFLKSHKANVLSAEPVRRMYSENGLKAI